MLLARPFGIPVTVHPLFLALAAGLLVWQGLTGGWAGAVAGSALGVGVFGSVLLHELGHALAARRLGIRTHHITLHPLGGLASLEGAPRTPQGELQVALAGPAVNLALAALAGLAWQAGAPLAGWLAAINLGMALFNLVPAYPMDGGRVLRAVLALHLPAEDATRKTLVVGRVFGWAFVAAGLLGAWNLALIGAFVLFAVRSERQRLTAPVAVAPARVRLRRFDHPVA